MSALDSLFPPMSQLLVRVIGVGSPHVLLRPTRMSGVVSDVFECVGARGNRSEPGEGRARRPAFFKSLSQRFFEVTLTEVPV